MAIVTLIVCRWKKKRQKRVVKPLPTGEASRRLRNELNNGTATQQTFEYFLAVPSTGVRILKQNNVEPHSRPLSESDRDSALLVSESSKFSHDRRVKDVNSINTHKAKENMFRSDEEEKGIERLVVALTQVQKENELNENTEHDNKGMQRKIKKKSIATKLGHMQKSADPTAHDHKHSLNLKHVSSTSSDESESDIDSSFKSEQHDLYSDVSGMTADISGNDCSTSDDNSSTLSKSSRKFIKANVRRFQRQNLREHLFNELAETEQNVELLKVSRRNIPSGAKLIKTIQQTSIHQCVNVDDEILPKRDGPLASSSFKCEYRKANSDMKVNEVAKNDNSKHKQDQGKSDDVILDNGEELNITPRKANLNRSFSLTEMDSFNRQNQNVQPNRRKRKYQSLRQPRRHTVDVFESMFNPNAMPMKGILKTTTPDSYETIPACYLEHQKPDVQIVNNTLNPTLNAPDRYSNNDHEDTSSDEKIGCSESAFEDTSGQVNNTKNSLPGESKLGKANLNETLTFSSKEECIQSNIVDLTDNISNSYKVDILSSNLAESKNTTSKTKENNVCLKNNVCARETAKHIERDTPFELANDDTNMHERALEQRRNKEVKLLNKLDNADSIFKVKGNTAELNEDCDNKDNIDCFVMEIENNTQSIAPNEHKLKCLDTSIQFDEDQAQSRSFANVNTTEHDTCSPKNLKSNTLNSPVTTHVYKTSYGTKTNTVNKSIASPSYSSETEIKRTLDGTEINTEHQSDVSPSCVLQTEITHAQGRFKADTSRSTDTTESKRIISAPTPGGKLGSFNYPRLCAHDDMYIAPTHVKEEYCSNMPTYKTAEPSRNLPRPKSSLGLRMSKPESVGTNSSYHATAKSGASTLRPVSPTQSTITPKVNVRYDNRWFVERKQPVASDKSSKTVLSLTSKLTTGIIKEPRTWEESTTSATEIVNDFKQIHHNEGDNVKKCYTLYERSPRPLKEPKENTIGEPFQFNDTKESTAEKLPKKVKSGKLAGMHLNQLQKLKDPSAGATFRSKTPTPHNAEFKQAFPQPRSKTPTPNIRHFEDKTSQYQTSEYQTPVAERGNDTESAQKNRHILFENRSKSFSVKDKQIETTRLKLNPLQPRTFANGGQRSTLDKPRSKTPTPSTNMADQQPVRPRSKTPTPRTEYLDDRMYFEPAKAVFKQKENFLNGNTKHRPQIELFSSNMVKHGTNKPFVVSTYGTRPSLPSASSFQQRSKTPTVSSLYTSTDNFTEKQLLTRRSRTPNKLTETMGSKTIPERPKSAMSVRRLTSEKTKCSRDNGQETLVHLSNLPLQASELIPYPGGNNSTNPMYPILGNSRPSYSSFRNLMEPWVSKVDASSAMSVKKSSIRNKKRSKKEEEQSTNVLPDGVVDIDEFLAGDDSEIEGVFKIPDEDIKSLKTEEEYTVNFIDDYERAYKTFKNRTTLTKSKSFKT